MVRTIPKRIISILMVCILSFMLCLAVPKYQVKAGILGGITIEIGMAVIALLGAFGITINLPEGLSDDEILSVIGTILPINKSYSEWKQDIAITEEGKIFASQDLVNQLLDKFYTHSHSYDLQFNPVSAASVVTVSSYNFEANDYSNIENDTSYSFNVNHVLDESDFEGAFNGYNFFYYNYLLKDSAPNLSHINDFQWNKFKDILTTTYNYTHDYYYNVKFLYDNSESQLHPGYYIDLIVFPFSQFYDKKIVSRAIISNVHGYEFATGVNISRGFRFLIRPDGFVGRSSYSASRFYSGYHTNDGGAIGTYLASNVGTFGSLSFLSQSAVLDRFYNPSLNSLNLDRIYSYIGSCVGLSIFQSTTATDTITIGLQDDAIDYPVSGTGVVVDTGVIAQDLDGWIEGVQEKVVTRDIPAEGTSSRATDFEISQVIAQPTALDFTDTVDYAAEQSLPTAYSANTNITLLNGIGSFFPFCIPFDLYEIFNGLNAPAQVPRFNWSIDFRSFGMGKHDFVIDLSNFATVCLIFKILTFIGFLIFLTLKTRDLIRG